MAGGYYGANHCSNCGSADGPFTCIFKNGLRVWLCDMCLDEIDDTEDIDTEEEDDDEDNC